jgi:hypothetical protein
MRDFFRVHSLACALLIGSACGCSSTIEQQRPATMPEDGSNAAGSPSEMKGLSGGAGAMAPSATAGSGGDPSLPGNGAAGTGSVNPPGQANAGTGGTTGMNTAGMGDTEQPVDPGECMDATMLWHEDFETGGYQRWTSNTYNADWGDDCQSTALTSETSVSPGTSQRSEISCAYGGDSVHRGYGGLQFADDQLVPAYTNQGIGIDAPDGLVNTMWVRLDSSTQFGGGKWMSLWTVKGSCDWDTPDAVLTVGIEDASDRLAAAHYQSGGGTRTFEPDAPGLPRGEWARITIYVNYHLGEMHVWQDGQSISHVTFTRPIQTICHWHWGLYASSDNDDVVLFEDDKSIWKLNEPLVDFSVEPYFGQTVHSCD